MAGKPPPMLRLQAVQRARSYSTAPLHISE